MKRNSNAVWVVGDIAKHPYYYVKTEDDKYLGILVADGSGNAHGFKITRRQARQLAKRINQCLDGTK